ncbi:uncharacterized protein LOC107464709 [Arachis duranensis]|uniref:Uncharacterized protein LOC107464709 n=1 Tax=Arachis duranensis TaxID=130453 RepID=A0A9C6T9N8_ARADU|nr:uncharacterized protein LOC107464709 [Arachis duranensis]
MVIPIRVFLSPKPCNLALPLHHFPRQHRCHGLFGANLGNTGIRDDVADICQRKRFGIRPRKCILKGRIDDQMSGQRETLAGLTLDDVLAKQKAFYHSQSNTKTLLDILKDDVSFNKNRKSWKAFKDTLLLKRYGSAWTRIPTSDIPISFCRRTSLKHFQSMADNTDNVDEVPALPPASLAPKATFSRRSSTRYSSPSEVTFTAGDPTEPAPAGSALLRPQLSRRNSSGMVSEPFRKGRVVTFRDNLDDEEQDEEDGSRADGSRTLSAREAVAAQEAAEAAAAGEVVGEGEEDEATQPVMMSLMDLLEETDREMGLEGSRYILSDEEDFDEDEEDEDGDGDDLEYTCSVCMVRHKANAISRCGHSYCRMCSRELMAGKGNCPLCNNFVVEILDIF